MDRDDPFDERQLDNSSDEESTEESVRAADSVSETASEGQKIITGIAATPVEMEWHQTASPWPRRLTWGGLSLLALLILIGQIGWHKFDTLNRIEPYRGMYQALCPIIGCSVPPSYDTRLIKSYNLVVRSHPKVQGALAIDSILLNTASFAQPFPKLTLIFSDINGTPIAQRTFEAAEYLGGELAGATEIPSQQPVHIALEILDPGADAVNYQLFIAGP